jgi:hypothetical protein
MYSPCTLQQKTEWPSLDLHVGSSCCTVRTLSVSCYLVWVGGEYRTLEVADNITELPRWNAERAQQALLTLALEIGERADSLYLRFTHWKSAPVTYFSGGYVDTTACLRASPGGKVFLRLLQHSRHYVVA